MTKIKKQDSLSKYLSKEDIKVINDLKSSIEEDEIVVTCMGLYNHGKSSLLNALIKDFKGKTFQTADVRKTTKSKKVKYKNLIYRDTPGLNAQKNDDKRVMDVVKQSDINIFVHNVNTGEFVAKEMEFFHRIKKHWDNPIEFIERTIFVLSRIDEANNIDDIENTALKIQQQIQEVFSINTQVIPISSKDYIDGMVEDEKELVEESMIPVLEKNIISLSDNLKESIKQTKQNRLFNHYNSLIKKLQAKAEEQKLELSKLKKEQKKIEIELQEDISKIKSTLKQKYETLRGI